MLQILHRVTIHATVVPLMKSAVKLTPVAIEDREKLGFSSGDTVRVWSKIEDKGKFRLQAFEGIVLSRKHGNKSTDATFTVRKVSHSVGVERIFPLYSPMIDKIEIVKRARARRSKLYYVREKAVKEVSRKMKTAKIFPEMVEEETTPEAEN